MGRRGLVGMRGGFMLLVELRFEFEFGFADEFGFFPLSDFILFGALHLISGKSCLQSSGLGNWYDGEKHNGL